MKLDELIFERKEFLDDWFCQNFLNWFHDDQTKKIDGQVLQNGSLETNDDKKHAQQAYFYGHPIETMFVSMTHDLLEEYSNNTSIPIDPLNIQDLSIKRYPKDSGFFGTHTDAGPGYASTRVLSLVVYLNDVEEGGGTYFPDFDLMVKAEKGKALVFPSNYLYRHSGEVPKSNEKYSITGFWHYCG